MVNFLLLFFLGVKSFMGMERALDFSTPFQQFLTD